MKKLTTATLITSICVLPMIFAFKNKNNLNLHEIICKYNQARNTQKQLENQLVSLLKVFETKVGNKPVELVRLGKSNDGGYVVPVIALKKTDALIGYGIANDISFEREFSQKFDKPSFGFDGGVQNIETGDKRCQFYSECIGDSDHLYPGQNFSGKISSYSEHIKRFKLTNKKIFIKMDIEGSEFNVFDDILIHKNNILGIVLECHLQDNLHKAIDLLSKINKDFILLHVHGNNASLNNYFTSEKSVGHVPYVLELTYINRNLVDSYRLSKNQKHPTEIDQPNCLNFQECHFEILVD